MAAFPGAYGRGRGRGCRPGGPPQGRNAAVVQLEDLMRHYASSYAHPGRVATQAARVLQLYDTLRAKAVSPPGTVRPLVCLTGTIPITYQGSQYHIPISILCPPGFPVDRPVIHVTPTASMEIKQQHNQVGSDGTVYLPALSEWHRASALIMVVQEMIAFFSTDPPVRSRPSPASNGPSSPWSGGSGAYNAYGSAGTAYAAPPMSGSVPHGQPPMSGGQPPPYPSGGGGGGGMSTSYPSGGYPSGHTGPAYGHATGGQPGYWQGATGSPQSRPPGYGHGAPIDTLAITRDQASGAVASRLRSFRSQCEEAIGTLRSEGAPARKALKALDAEKALLEQEIARLHAQEKQAHRDIYSAEDWIAQHQPKPGYEQLSVDERTADPIPRKEQLFELVAESESLSDTMYALNQALQRGAIDMDTFIKSYRSLAHRQYVAKATLLRIGAEYDAAR